MHGDEQQTTKQDRFWYLIYEHMPGGTLTEHLGTGRQFTEAEAKAMAARWGIVWCSLYICKLIPSFIMLCDAMRCNAPITGRRCMYVLVSYAFCAACTIAMAGWRTAAMICCCHHAAVVVGNSISAACDWCVGGRWWSLGSLNLRITAVLLYFVSPSLQNMIILWCGFWF